jgi:hypothetical protein
MINAGVYPSKWKKIVKENNTKHKSNKLELKKIKQNYYKSVWNITNSNSNKLPNIENRGFKSFHIDHIVPISYGYKNNINPQLIGSIDNLVLIGFKENTKKGTKLNEKAKELLKNWGILVK